MNVNLYEAWFRYVKYNDQRSAEEGTASQMLAEKLLPP